MPLLKEEVSFRGSNTLIDISLLARPFFYMQEVALGIKKLDESLEGLQLLDPLCDLSVT